MEKVIKTWGWEHWFANNNKYCGKLIFIEFDRWSSKGAFHHHDIKDETFFILEGSLKLEYIENDLIKEKILNVHDSFRLKPRIKHRFKTNTKDGCLFIEASTSHFDDDSYREFIQ